MPALLLIGIPIAVIVLFWGIMTLPDEDLKKEILKEVLPGEKKKVKAKKK